MTGERPLVLVSNRGPATFERDEGDPQGPLTVSRGGGGLVTALTGLVEHREAVGAGGDGQRAGRAGGRVPAVRGARGEPATRAGAPESISLRLPGLMTAGQQAKGPRISAFARPRRPSESWR